MNGKEFLTVTLTLGLIVTVLVFTLVTKHYVWFAGEILMIAIFHSLTEGATPNEHIVCPHCKTKGKTFTRSIEATKGISGGKAVAGLLTGGLSILAVGISRHESQTECRCGQCGSIWHF